MGPNLIHFICRLQGTGLCVRQHGGLGRRQVDLSVEKSKLEQDLALMAGDKLNLTVHARGLECIFPMLIVPHCMESHGRMIQLYMLKCVLNSSMSFSTEATMAQQESSPSLVLKNCIQISCL